MSVYIFSSVSEKNGGWAYTVSSTTDNGVTCQWGTVKENQNKSYIDIIGLYKACEFINLDNVMNIYINSKYIIDGLQLCEEWKSNNWKSKNDKQIKNKDMWELIYDKQQKHNVIISTYLETPQNNTYFRMSEQLSNEAASCRVTYFPELTDSGCMIN
jgi:ribonuclease HI